MGINDNERGTGPGAGGRRDVRESRTAIPGASIGVMAKRDTAKTNRAATPCERLRFQLRVINETIDDLNNREQVLLHRIQYEERMIREVSEEPSERDIWFYGGREEAIEGRRQWLPSRRRTVAHAQRELRQLIDRRRRLLQQQAAVRQQILEQCTP